MTKNQIAAEAFELTGFINECNQIRNNTNDPEIHMLAVIAHDKAIRIRATLLKAYRYMDTYNE